MNSLYFFKNKKYKAKACGKIKANVKTLNYSTYYR